MSYYSARLHIICLVDDEEHKESRNYTCDYPILLFTASDNNDAFARALELGKKQEAQYLNSFGNKVRWALKAVEQIWILGDSIDGAEVGSTMDSYQPDAPVEFDVEFQPELQSPSYSDERHKPHSEPNDDSR